MVCSATQYAAESYINEPEEGARKIPGLGFVNFEIYPYFKESLRSEIESFWCKGKLYLLKDGEAIYINNDKISVFVEERLITN